MVQLLNFLRALAADSTLLHEKVDKDYRRFFYDDFTMGLLKRLTKEKSRDDKVRPIFTPFPLSITFSYFPIVP